jgi:hypothetical protein
MQLTPFELAYVNAYNFGGAFFNAAAVSGMVYAAVATEKDYQTIGEGTIPFFLLVEVNEMWTKIANSSTIES